MGNDVSERITEEDVRKGFFDWPHPRLIASALRGETEFLNRAFRIPWARIRAAAGMSKIADMKGCNFSIPKQAFEAINGFDEAYEGYGREDTDVELRLQNLGYRIKSLKGIALQFHLWHPRREFTPMNDDLLEDVRRSRRYLSRKGMRQEV